MMIILFSKAMVYYYGWKIARVIRNFQSFKTLGIYVKHFLMENNFDWMQSWCSDILRWQLILGVLAKVMNIHWAPEQKSEAICLSGLLKWSFLELKQAVFKGGLNLASSWSPWLADSGSRHGYLTLQITREEMTQHKGSEKKQKRQKFYSSEKLRSL